MKSPILFCSLTLLASCSSVIKPKVTNNQAVRQINEFKEVSVRKEMDQLVRTDNKVERPKFLRDVTTDKVNFWIKYFTTRDKARFERFLKNGQKYRPLIEKVFADHGLPKDLFYVGLIESGYYLGAKSHAGAVGPWQFIKATGRRYGLNITSRIDERRSIHKATVASAKFFQDLYNIFGSWELALSAYNAGEYGVIRRIRTANTRDYYKLCEQKKLPKETRHYVPKVLAAMKIVKNPKRYGIKIPRAKENIYSKARPVNIKGRVHLSKISKNSGHSIAIIKKLNPDLKTNTIPYVKRKGHTLYMPIGDYSFAKKITNKSSHRLNKKRLAKKTKNKKTHFYKVKKGDSLYAIARKNNTTISKIQRLNKLKKKTVFVGQKLKIPYTNKTYHTVRPGEHLIKIASLYGVSVKKIKSLNTIRKSKIYPGQKLVVKFE